MPTTIRMTDVLQARLDEKAESEGVSRNDLIVRYLERGLETDGTDVLKLSVSQIACMDQLAERAGVTRIELMRRWLSERLSREFVDNRNRLLQDAKVKASSKA
jgi:DNA-binding phage protein